MNLVLLRFRWPLTCKGYQAFCASIYCKFFLSVKALKSWAFTHRLYCKAFVLRSASKNFPTERTEEKTAPITASVLRQPGRFLRGCGPG